MDLIQNILRSLRSVRRTQNIEDGLKEGSSNDTPQHSPAHIAPPQRVGTSWTSPDPNSQLALFRHLIGIHSTKSLMTDGAPGQNFGSPQGHFDFDGRAVPNIGIYNRVCHREAQAKRGYKFAAIFINSCLGIQVIVAAALTALGASKGSHVSITAFGGINTVIAGLLTYLKGSGLPNRVKFYENEWKRIREYIEQRERDFSRPNCTLDVERVVAAIEAMYEEVKIDIQNNTPEMYISVSDLRNRKSSATTPQAPSVQDLIRSAEVKGRSRIEDLELKYGHKVTDLLEGLAQKEAARLKKIEADIESSATRALDTVENTKNDAVKGARDWEKEMEGRGMAMAERELEHARMGVRDFGSELQAKGAQAVQREREQAELGLRSWQDRGTRIMEQEAEHARSSLFNKGVEFARSLDSARMVATQRGQEYEREVEAKAAELAEAQRRLRMEAERIQAVAQKAGEDVQLVGNEIREGVSEMERAADQSIQRAGGSIQRIEKAIEDEIQPAPKK